MNVVFPVFYRKTNLLDLRKSCFDKEIRSAWDIYIYIYMKLALDSDNNISSPNLYKEQYKVENFNPDTYQ